MLALRLTVGRVASGLLTRFNALPVIFTVPVALVGPVPESVRLFIMNGELRLLLEVIVPAGSVLHVRYETVARAPFCGRTLPLQLAAVDQLRVDPVVVAV